MRLSALTYVLFAIATPLAADGFERIDQRDGFLSIIKDRDLTRFGIKLEVSPSGAIAGRAFGRKVTGAWNWRDGFFCRDLYLGGKELDADNCQLVQVKGNTVRFTSDRGKGDSADLRLR